MMNLAAPPRVEGGSPAKTPRMGQRTTATDPTTTSVTTTAHMVDHMDVDPKTEPNATARHPCPASAATPPTYTPMPAPPDAQRQPTPHPPSPTNGQIFDLLQSLATTVGAHHVENRETMQHLHSRINAADTNIAVVQEGLERNQKLTITLHDKLEHRMEQNAQHHMTILDSRIAKLDDKVRERQGEQQQHIEVAHKDLQRHLEARHEAQERHWNERFDQLQRQVQAQAASHAAATKTATDVVARATAAAAAADAAARTQTATPAPLRPGDPSPQALIVAGFHQDTPADEVEAVTRA